MSFFSWLYTFFLKPEKLPPPPLDITGLPDPFVPWEIWGHYTSPWEIRNTMGAQENWYYGIWEPYWMRLTPSEREVFSAKAPNEEWREWLKTRSQWMEESLAKNCSPSELASPADIEKVMHMWLSEKQALD